MPDIEVTIGGREFTVACQAGEEHFLQTAAGMLDREAAAIMGATGRIPADRMLLMAGLLLADRTAAMEDRVREAEDKLARRDALISELQDRPAPAPERVEVPVIPEHVKDTLAELAAQAEAVAAEVEERAAG